MSNDRWHWRTALGTPLTRLATVGVAGVLIASVRGARRCVHSVSGRQRDAGRAVEHGGGRIRVGGRLPRRRAPPLRDLTAGPTRSS